MFNPYQSYFYTNLLYDQHRYYTELANKCQRELQRQYERVAKIETSIAQRHQVNMLRKQKKHLQWSRAKIQRQIRDTERQQWYLQECIRQFEMMMAYCGNNATMNGSTVASIQLPYPVTPFSALSTVPPGPTIADYQEPTKYWDLSMLRERGGSAASVPSADSGFYEPSVFHQVPYYENTSVSPLATTLLPAAYPRQDSLHSENDTVGELGLVASPAKVGAELQRSKHHQRRYSENAIQLIESRLASPRGHNRVRSVDQIPSFGLTTWNR